MTIKLVQPNKLTVLQVVPTLDIGGAERTTIDVARALMADGCRAIVASRGGRLVRELEQMGAEHVELPVHSKNPVVMGLNVERLTRLIEKQNVDIVHARSRAPAWSALAAARRTKRPFVTTYHSKVHERPRLKVFYNSVMTRGAVVIANSEFTAERIRKFHGETGAKIVTIPRGTDMTEFDPSGPAVKRGRSLREKWGGGTGDTLFMLAGRLTRWKGQLLATEALGLMNERMGTTAASAKLILVGDAQGRSDYEDEIKAAIEAHNPALRVRLVGHCDDMPAAYSAADVVLAPSLDPEPFGRSAVEAQAMAKPVIVADHGGAKDTVLDASDTGGSAAATGWRVTPSDADALATAMAEALAANSTDRQAMGARGRSFVEEQFSVTAMTDRTLAVYHDLVDG
ncbi:MAG: glycosyltransferase family 4 protein [Rhodobiaceae bacterium]|nr:glycosyltransferase family 4 protein [Rhodobiaceae bacterium]